MLRSFFFLKRERNQTFKVFFSNLVMTNFQFKFGMGGKIESFPTHIFT